MTTDFVLYLGAVCVLTCALSYTLCAIFHEIAGPGDELGDADDHRDS